MSLQLWSRWVAASMVAMFVQIPADSGDTADQNNNTATVARRHGTPHMEHSEAAAGGEAGVDPGGEAGVDWWLGFTTFVTVVTFTGNFW